jgi:hypothetical protein
MPDVTTIPRQHDPSLCPSWCNREHVDQAPNTGGFHHDAESVSVLVAAHDSIAEQLFVHASQWVPDGRPARRPLVELQNQSQALALLTADEAVDLATALLVAAAQVRDL